MNLRFGLISDIHLGPPATFGGRLRKLSHQAETLVQSFVRAAEEARLDLIINLGDVVEDSSPSEDRERYQRLMDLLAKVGCPVLHVAGNHDCVNLEPQLAKLWSTPSLYYSYQLDGCSFFVLHSQETKDTAVHLPESQLAWLRGELGRCEYPAIVLIHHPVSDMNLDGNRWFEQAPHICRVAERRALRKVLEDSGKVVAVINGHAHWNHLDLIAGIPYITLQSLIENVEEDAPGRAAAAWGIGTLDDKVLHLVVHGEHPVRYQIELPGTRA